MSKFTGLAAALGVSKSNNKDNNSGNSNINTTNTNNNNSSSANQSNTSNANNKSEAPLIRDITTYLIGTWTRTLRHQSFGFEYNFIKTSHSVIRIEEYHSIDPEPNTRYLKWSFGKNLNGSDLAFGYIMKCISSTQPELAGETQIEWQYSGDHCTGIYQPITAVITLNFHLKTQTQIINYKIQNQSTMAVCVVDCDQTGAATVQLGNMTRVQL